MTDTKSGANLNRQRPTAHKLLALVAVTMLFSGCFSLSARELAEVRRELENQMPEARFEKEIELSLGRMTMGTVKWLCLVIPDAREARKYLKDISGVSVAVYEVESLPPLNEVELPKRLKRLLEDKGWDVLIKAREEDQIVWILYQERRSSIRNLYVLALEPDELVLMSLRGRLDRLFAQALEESDTRKLVPGLALD
jgi:hypothetical protein